MNSYLIGVAAVAVLYVLWNEYRWYDLKRFFRALARIGEKPVEKPPTVNLPVPVQAPTTPRDWEKVKAASDQVRAAGLAVAVPTPPAPPRRVLTREFLAGILLETRHFMLTKGPDINMNPTETYDTIKARYRKKEQITVEQIQQALDHHRALVQETAVTAATLSGEHWAQAKLLPFSGGEGAPGNNYWQARQAHEKAMRHMSKLVYWYAKVQAGALYETTGGSAGAPMPYSAHDGLEGHDEPEDEDEDEEEEEEDEEEEDEEYDEDD